MDKDTSKFTTTPNQIKIEKPWGYEFILSPEDSKVTSKIIHVNQGKRLSLQYHDEKEEIMTLLTGEAYIHIEDSNGQVQKVNMELKKGYFVTPFQTHRVEAITDCDILESSTRETGNTVRLEDDYKRGTETEEARQKRTQGGTTYMG